MSGKFVSTSLKEHRFLKTLSGVFTEDEIEVFAPASAAELSRITLDGIVPVIGRVGESARVAAVFFDFRASGGSLGKENSDRLAAFIRIADEKRIPLVLILNSLGVRFMEGRTVFRHAFQVLPELFKFKRNNLLMTVASGKCLGISALFFGQGHYRVALGKETQINLTGPEVHRLFFGGDTEFATFASSAHQFERNSLIHEVHDSETLAFCRVRSLLRFLGSSTETLDAPDETIAPSGEYVDVKMLNHSIFKTAELLERISDARTEIFTQQSPVVKTYILKKADRLFGVFINPISHANNLLTVSSVRRAIDAIDLFKALGLPVISILDSPGGDPRAKESDADTVMKMLTLVEKMIDYPYPKTGFVVGRCYGGSSMFAFPSIFGSRGCIAVKGSRFGVMNDAIVDSLLIQSPRFKEQWRQVSASQTPDLGDLVRTRNLDAVIAIEELEKYVLRFLFLGPKNSRTRERAANLPAFVDWS